jgi:L-ascorbate metabolism protein UlaG (beta-lactamase superfamily)
MNAFTLSFSAMAIVIFPVTMWHHYSSKIVFVAILSAATFGPIGCVSGVPYPHPKLDAYRHFEQPPSANGSLTVRFLGTTTLLFQDDSTTILSDGFVTRPGVFRLALPIAPDTSRIRRTLTQLGVDSIAAVFTLHSHYDHAMDAPVFAGMTGANLVGSRSTAMLGAGLGLPQNRLITIRSGQEIQYGRFHLTFIAGIHGDPDRAPGFLDRPMKPPARWKAWKGDTSYSVLVRHDERTMLIQGSPGFIAGGFDGIQADVIYLSIGGMKDTSPGFLDLYWREVVKATRAKRVILVHWDDFFEDLDSPLRPLPFPRGSFYRAVNHLLELGQRENVEVLLPVAWRPTDPFSGLE